MKILWFTGNPSLYKRKAIDAGWIGALELMMRKINDIELAISFTHSDKIFKVNDKNITYYPITERKSILHKIEKVISSEKYDQQYLNSMQKVIEDFKPDIIQIWGSEIHAGLIAKYTTIPVVLHIQGIINPYLQAWFPPGFSLRDIKYHYGVNIIKKYYAYRDLQRFKVQAKREKTIYKSIKHYMGRTEWDKAVTNILSPSSNYYYCSEMLREAFYTNKKWEYKERNKTIIITTISQAIYKGADLILKTAKILKEHNLLDFEWHIIGLSELHLMEKQYHINASSNNICLKGKMTANGMVQELLDCDMYVHPSYIDNSPNSVCEAQILGTPVIATHVGGISSLIENKRNGILTPANDPYTLAYQIRQIKQDKNLASQIGYNGQVDASKRHNPETILSTLLQTYQEIINL